MGKEVPFCNYNTLTEDQKVEYREQIKKHEALFEDDRTIYDIAPFSDDITEN